METRAPYALIGFFVLAVVAGVFGFVYWLHNSGGLGERTVYSVRFENTVSGLLTGAPLLFDGIRVGEVTGLSLDLRNPRQVTATIAVVSTTPIRTDTQAGLEYQGLTGVPVVSLLGGASTAPLFSPSPTEPPILVGRPHGRAKRDRGGTPGAAPDRFRAGGQFRPAEECNRKPQHFHRSARTQFGSRRHDSGWS